MTETPEARAATIHALSTALAGLAAQQGRLAQEMKGLAEALTAPRQETADD